MPRFLLLFVLLVASGCELPSIIQADQYLDPIPVEPSPRIPKYENVWEPIKGNRSIKGCNSYGKTLE